MDLDKILKEPLNNFLNLLIKLMLIIKIIKFKMIKFQLIIQKKKIKFIRIIIKIKLKWFKIKNKYKPFRIKNKSQLYKIINFKLKKIRITIIIRNFRKRKMNT